VIVHRQLIRCTFGLAIVNGAADEKRCANCGRSHRKKFAVKFPSGSYGIICPICNRKYRNRREFISHDSDLFFKQDGKEVVTPTCKFFSGLIVNAFVQTIVDYYNKNGYITQKQYDAAIAVSKE